MWQFYAQDSIENVEIESMSGQSGERAVVGKQGSWLNRNFNDYLVIVSFCHY